ncbi:MAG: NADH-quinone oxidoreductase subunit E, partial [Actinobacteria bacterium]|nr:NADH-quinone oxidoreductase subunit E [Actinomycetota bacterium]
MSPTLTFPTLPDGGRAVGAPARAGERLLVADVELSRSGPADPVRPTAAETLAEHVARLGPRPAGTPELVDVVQRSGLVGHGGAHVPAALKWRAAAAGRGPLTVVANAAESEPVAAKDGT